MPWRMLLRRIFQETFERDLSNNRFIRRLAQLTVYQLTRTSEWRQEMLERLSTNFRWQRFLSNFLNNLKKELQNKPPNKKK